MGQLTTAAPNGGPTELQSKDHRDLLDVIDRLRSQEGVLLAKRLCLCHELLYLLVVGQVSAGL